MDDIDAESDTESYFLTPVNEYDIMDKIQSANNQLFASIAKENDIKTQSIVMENITSNADKFLLQSKHRVTFSSDIEEYEDEVSESESVEIQYKEEEEAIIKEIAEIIERGERKPESLPSTEHFNGNDDNHIDGLLKRMSIEEIYSNEEDSLSDVNDYTNDLKVVQEINEVIFEEYQNNEQTPSPVSFQLTNNHLNVQTSDQTEEKKKPQILSKPNGNHLNKINENQECRPCNRTNNRMKSANMKRIKIFEPNRIATANCYQNSTHKNTNKHDDLLKIHLNVRPCCENKYLDNNRLPRYNGYISQYGLSKDQLEMRELNRQKYLEKRAQREREIMHAKQKIAYLNELAFQQWLIRKSHSARPKYKNMYGIIEPKPKIKYHSLAKFRKSNANTA